MSSDALVKIKDCVDSALTTQLRTVKETISSKLDEVEKKLQFTQRELLLKVSSLELEVVHLKERLDRVNAVFGAEDDSKPTSTVKRAKKKSKPETDGSEKVKTITDFCSWKWVNDPEFRAKYATDDNMEKINSVATVKSAKDEQVRLRNEGRAFYSKVVNAKGANANPALSDEIKKAFDDFKKPFDDLKLDDRDSAIGDTTIDPVGATIGDGDTLAVDGAMVDVAA
jgi:hypothetical protein